MGHKPDFIRRMRGASDFPHRVMSDGKPRRGRAAASLPKPFIQSLEREETGPYATVVASAYVLLALQLAAILGGFAARPLPG